MAVSIRAQLRQYDEVATDRVAAVVDAHAQLVAEARVAAEGALSA